MEFQHQLQTQIRRSDAHFGSLSGKTRSKLYQEGDIEDGEDGFADGAGEVSPVESDPRGAELLHEDQAGLTRGLSRGLDRGLDRVAGAEQRRH